MILYGFGATHGVEDPSPFVLKVHTYLRMAGIEYESRGNLGYLRKAPKGKLPYLKDGDNIIADSSFIIDHLKEKYPNDLDSHLSAEEKSQAYFAQKAFEESWYWCGVYFRWEHEPSWQKLKSIFFKNLSFPLSLIVPSLARRGIVSSINSQGIGRHTESEILSIAKQHFDHFDTQLTNKQYWFGDQPSSMDAIAFAFLAQAILFELDNPVSRLAKQYGNLTSYCERMNERYFLAS